MIFSVELDLLEIRLRELYPVVDHFVIVESNTSFTGQHKPLVFAQHQDEPRFSWAAEKIIHRTLALPQNIPGLSHAETTWSNERRSRREINDVLRSYGARPGDLLIQADVDEIPSARTMQLMKSCEGYPHVIHLQLRTHIYSFARQVPDNEGTGSWRASIKSWDPYSSGYTGYMHGRQGDMILADAGWHCSCHFDRVTDPVRQLDPKEIQQKICAGQDVFDMLPEAYSFWELVRLMGPYPITKSFINLPWWLTQDAELFKYLLRPEDCVREDSRQFLDMLGSNYGQRMHQ